jgi:hypothetical protein
MATWRRNESSHQWTIYLLINDANLNAVLSVFTLYIAHFIQASSRDFYEAISYNPSTFPLQVKCQERMKLVLGPY